MYSVQSVGGLVSLWLLFSVNELHILNHLGEVSEVAVFSPVLLRTLARLARVTQPFAGAVRCWIVANINSIGLVVRKCRQCVAG